MIFFFQCVFNLRAGLAFAQVLGLQRANTVCQGLIKAATGAGQLYRQERPGLSSPSVNALLYQSSLLYFREKSNPHHPSVIKLCKAVFSVRNNPPNLRTALRKGH